MYKNVRAEMSRKGIILEDLAEVLGVTVPTVSQKLNGKYPITLNEAKIIKKRLGVDMPLEELFEVSEEGE